MLAKKLAKEGAILVLWDIDEKSNENTKNEILDEGGKAFAYKCDVTSKDEIYRVAQQVSELNKIIFSKLLNINYAC